MAPSESGGDRIKFRNLTGMSSDEGENSASIPVVTRILELEQRLKQWTVSSYRIQRPKTSCFSYRIQRPKTIEDPPDELLRNIFTRLLAKKLAQMRSVSKSWNGLLSDPSFVKSHLHRSIHNNNQQILLVFPNCNKLFKQYSCKSSHLEPINFINDAPNNLPMSRVIGSVNGLICLSEVFYSNIHIWNPSLSAISAIPPPHSLSAMSTITPPHHDPYMSTSMWFGFDTKTNDYKLVKIEGVHNHDYATASKWLKVEVYSMRKGSWEFITQTVPSHIKRIYDTDYLCVDGHHGYLHGLIETFANTETKILAFDLGSETFREMPLPDAIRHFNNKKHLLGVLDGKLCEMLWCKAGGWEVWVMEEYGVPESWAKRHVFSQFTRNICLYGFTSRYELLLQDRYGQLIVYDSIANKTKSIHTKQKASGIVEFVDSLVWI